MMRAFPYCQLLSLANMCLSISLFKVVREVNSPTEDIKQVCMTVKRYVNMSCLL